MRYILILIDLNSGRILNIGSVRRQGFGGAALNKFWLCLTSMEPADAHAESAGEERSNDPRYKAWVLAGTMP